MPDHAKQIFRLNMVRDLMEPIPVSEAKEDLQRFAYDSPELPHGDGLTDIQLVHRIQKTVQQHQECGLVEVRDQKQQEVLVPKLIEPGLAVDDEPLAAISHDRKHPSTAHESSPRPRP